MARLEMPSWWRPPPPRRRHQEALGHNPRPRDLWSGSQTMPKRSTAHRGFVAIEDRDGSGMSTPNVELEVHQAFEKTHPASQPFFNVPDDHNFPVLWNRPIRRTARTHSRRWSPLWKCGQSPLHHILVSLVQNTSRKRTAIVFPLRFFWPACSAVAKRLQILLFWFTN